MKKKDSGQEFTDAKTHLKRAYQNLTELRQRKLEEVRQVEDKISAPNTGVHALFGGKGNKR